MQNVVDPDKEQDDPSEEKNWGGKQQNACNLLPLITQGRHFALESNLK